MNLKSCVKCGVVVDFNVMQEATTDNEITTYENQNKFGYKLENGYEEGFFCPCCKKYVVVWVD